MNILFLILCTFYIALLLFMPALSQPSMAVFKALPIGVLIVMVLKARNQIQNRILITLLLALSFSTLGDVLLALDVAASELDAARAVSVQARSIGAVHDVVMAACSLQRTINKDFYVSGSVDLEAEIKGIIAAVAGAYDAPDLIVNTKRSHSSPLASGLCTLKSLKSHRPEL